MTYRVYLRWANQKVSDKTVTEDRAIAELAYKSLLERKDLVGKAVGAAFTQRVGGQPQQIAFHAFDKDLPEDESHPSTLHLKKR